MPLWIIFYHSAIMFGLYPDLWIAMRNPYCMDLSDLEAINNTYRTFSYVNTLICNVRKGLFGNLEQLSTAQIAELFTINVLSHIHLVKYLLPYMKTQAHSNIIFIGSEAALARKRKGRIYCASKFALRGFAHSLNDECRSSSVRISSIHPVMARTPFYDNLSFTPGESSNHAIWPQAIADAVAAILAMQPTVICHKKTKATPHNF